MAAVPVTNQYQYNSQLMAAIINDEDCSHCGFIDNITACTVS